jgi:hypothetical protein
MTVKIRAWMALLLCCVVVACCSCVSDEFADQAREEGVYTRYNLHYVAEHGTVKGSFANWTDWPGHGFVPYNSKVRAELWSNRIRFTTDAGLRILFEMNPARMRMTTPQYVALITSPTPVTYEGLSDVDRQGIETGKALVGMSKQGVEIALGYPARHRTPSLDDNRWTYWKGRHDSYVVEFDSDGKVVRIGQ